MVPEGHLSGITLRLFFFHKIAKARENEFGGLVQLFGNLVHTAGYMLAPKRNL
ncbi:hypothetical protein SAMN04488122_1265 [Chitinophaga arvensicola]|uniref:Uncharacterized protein n=1 Tax=Chitinophaga arvensicola TaxID=29529 RepID=A0A1I0Q7V7_9BACT|nr:hypothetical protein SAMN04488122_1265 [Chitinophaga arvensicola]